jgi:enoyl-CoA hydratase/carnithine racemase
MASRCSALVTTTIIAHAHHHQKKALIARVTLNNVKKRNALSYTMLKELQTHLTKTELDPDIHVIILNANGPVFSSGHDLHELQQQQQQQQQKQQQDDENADHDANFATTNRMNIIHNNNTSTTDLMDLCSSVMQTITQMTKPVIAQVDGIATAAGCQLVASCDLAYASNNAQFATPGVNIGLFCSTPAVALSRTIHTKHAMHMLLTGDMISAKEAERIGLINAVVVVDDDDDDDDDKNNNLDEVVLDVAMKIASKSSTSIGIGKPIFYKQLGMSLEDAYKLTSNVMVENMKHDDAVEGIDAFLTKRIPNWSTFTFATTTATTTSKPNNSKSSSNIPFEK